MRRPLWVACLLACCLAVASAGCSGSQRSACLTQHSCQWCPTDTKQGGKCVDAGETCPTDPLAKVPHAHELRTADVFTQITCKHLVAFAFHRQTSAPIAVRKQGLRLASVPYRFSVVADALAPAATKWDIKNLPSEDASFLCSAQPAICQHHQRSSTIPAGYHVTLSTQRAAIDAPVQAEARTAAQEWYATFSSLCETKKRSLFSLAEVFEKTTVDEKLAADSANVFIKVDCSKLNDEDAFSVEVDIETPLSFISKKTMSLNAANATSSFESVWAPYAKDLLPRMAPLLQADALSEFASSGRRSAFRTDVQGYLLFWMLYAQQASKVATSQLGTADSIAPAPRFSLGKAWGDLCASLAFERMPATRKVAEAVKKFLDDNKYSIGPSAEKWNFFSDPFWARFISPLVSPSTPTFPPRLIKYCGEASLAVVLAIRSSSSSSSPSGASFANAFRLSKGSDEAFGKALQDLSRTFVASKCDDSKNE